jgi:mannosyl-3-phosphoglycerate phosphatase
MLPARVVIFTDLDGTLLDHHTYAWSAAREALEVIERRRIPLIFSTSKTRAEVEVLRRKMGNAHPFITENGGGVFLPHGYFPQHISGTTRAGRYHCLGLARPYAEIIEELVSVAEAAGADVVGFHQMSPREIAKNTGLPLRQAELARQRDFDEPFFFASASEKLVQKFVHLAKRRGLEVQRGGRFWHLFAGSDKGRAVRQLVALYRASSQGRLRSLALGDSANDLPMLAAVDWAVLLPKPDGSFDRQVIARLPNVVRGVAPGPVGWNEAVLRILSGV